MKFEIFRDEWYQHQDKKTVHERYNSISVSSQNDDELREKKWKKLPSVTKHIIFQLEFTLPSFRFFSSDDNEIYEHVVMFQYFKWNRVEANFWVISLFVVIMMQKRKLSFPTLFSIRTLRNCWVVLNLLCVINRVITWSLKTRWLLDVVLVHMNQKWSHLHIRDK